MPGFGISCLLGSPEAQVVPLTSFAYFPVDSLFSHLCSPRYIHVAQSTRIIPSWRPEIAAQESCA
jgi:hypothetical protein